MGFRDSQRYRKVYGYYRPLPRPEDYISKIDKDYLDEIFRSLDWKQSVRLAADNNVSLSSPGAIDGFSLLNEDRILLIGQTNPAENGIYMYYELSDSLVRTLDATQDSLTSGATCYVETGTYATKIFCLTTQDPIVVDSTNLTWEVQGMQGIQGALGVQGLQGVQGTQGEQGLQGLQGTQGAQGLQGIQGTQGEQGLQGVQGTQGEQGLQGIQGTQGFTGATGSGGVIGNFGTFYDTTTQANLLGPTNPNLITFNSQYETPVGISIVDGSKITFTNQGTYNIQFSSVFTKTNSNSHDIEIWFSKNGTVIPNSNTVVTVAGQSNSIASWNFVLSVNAGDYVQMYWYTDDSHISMVSIPASTSPDRPFTPSVILTVQQVMYTQLGPQGAAGTQGPQGAGGIAVSGTDYSNYIYWDGSAWAVGTSTVHLGSNSGLTSQGTEAIAIGTNTAKINQGNYSISLGSGAGYQSQNFNSVAIGYQAGYQSQGYYSIAIGEEAAKNNQRQYSIALGRVAGRNSQGEYSIAIGNSAGYQGQGGGTFGSGFGDAIAIGSSAGAISQSNYSIAIGNGAGSNNQGYVTGKSIAIGYSAGSTNQSIYSVAIGNNAGNLGQGGGTTTGGAVAIGNNAGSSTQGKYSVSIGNSAGYQGQGGGVGFAVAVGSNAGELNQKNYAIAVGYAAGGSGQGASSIALGAYAGATNQHDNSIILNATGAIFNSDGNNRTYINPIRNISSTGANTKALVYDTSTKEVSSIAITAVGGGGPTFIPVFAGSTSTSLVSSSPLVVGSTYIDPALFSAFTSFKLECLLSATDGAHTSTVDLYDYTTNTLIASVSTSSGITSFLSSTTVTLPAAATIYEARLYTSNSSSLAILSMARLRFF